MLTVLTLLPRKSAKVHQMFQQRKYDHLSNCLIVDYDGLLTLHIQIINGDKKYINKYDK